MSLPNHEGFFYEITKYHGIGSDCLIDDCRLWRYTL